MAYIVMAYTVMAMNNHRLYSYGLYKEYGPHSYGDPRSALLLLHGIPERVQGIARFLAVHKDSCLLIYGFVYLRPE